jgi:hypothetical protein
MARRARTAQCDRAGENAANSGIFMTTPPLLSNPRRCGPSSSGKAEVIGLRKTKECCFSRSLILPGEGTSPRGLTGQVRMAAGLPDRNDLMSQLNCGWSPSPQRQGRSCQPSRRRRRLGRQNPHSIQNRPGIPLTARPAGRATPNPSSVRISRSRSHSHSHSHSRSHCQPPTCGGIATWDKIPLPMSRHSPHYNDPNMAMRPSTSLHSGHEAGSRILPLAEHTAPHSERAAA